MVNNSVLSGVLDPSKIFKLTLWHSKKCPKYSHNIHPIYLQPIGPKYVLNLARNKHILQCLSENNRKPLSYLLWFTANFTLLNLKSPDNSLSLNSEWIYACKVIDITWISVKVKFFLILCHLELVKEKQSIILLFYSLDFEFLVC